MIGSSIDELPGIAERGRSALMALEGQIQLARDVLPILERVVTESLFAAGVPGRAEPGTWLTVAASGVPRASTLSAYAELEQSLAVGTGLLPPDLSWTLGHSWRALYPAVVARLGGEALAEDDWPAFHHLSAELERVAFGPAPINVTQPRAWTRSRRRRFSAAPRPPNATAPKRRKTHATRLTDGRAEPTG